MARLLSRTLLRQHSSPPPPPPFLLPLRRRSSSKSTPGYLIEIDLSSASAASSAAPNGAASDDDGGEKDVAVEKAAVMAQLQDMYSYFTLLKSTPSWLPFLPGSCFWVPPEHRPRSVPELVDEWSNRLTPEEFHSLATCRGFPSSHFYLSDISSRKLDQKASVAITVIGRKPTPDVPFLAWARCGVAVTEPEEEEHDGEINVPAINADES